MKELNFDERQETIRTLIKYRERLMKEYEKLEQELKPYNDIHRIQVN